MARPLLIGVSLKMYFPRARTLAWADAVAALCRSHPATASGAVEFFVLPTFPSIPALLALDAPWSVGAQDIAAWDAGAYTGEVSGVELAELGCRFAEVGHVERRRLFGEDDDAVAAKTDAALRNGLDPVLCVGETRRGAAVDAIAVCVDQVRTALAPATAAGHGGRVVVAYEPHWAIGAPEPASPEHISAVCGGIAAAFRTGAAHDIRVIYGGSAGPGLLSRIVGDVDGLFLGRFAHDPDAVRAVLDEAAAIGRPAA